MYEIKHADGSTTVQTVTERGGEKTVTEEKTPAPANYVPPEPTTPIAAPRELPSDAGWNAKRTVEFVKGVKTSTTTYAINDPSGVGAYTQIEVKSGDGDVLVTKTKPVK